MNCATCGEKISPRKAYYRDVVRIQEERTGPSRHRHLTCRPGGWGLLDVAYPDGVSYVIEAVPPASETREVERVRRGGTPARKAGTK